MCKLYKQNKAASVKGESTPVNYIVPSFVRSLFMFTDGVDESTLRCVSKSGPLVREEPGPVKVVSICNADQFAMIRCCAKNPILRWHQQPVWTSKLVTKRPLVSVVRKASCSNVCWKRLQVEWLCDSAKSFGTVATSQYMLDNPPYRAPLSVDRGFQPNWKSRNQRLSASAWFRIRET